MQGFTEERGQLSKTKSRLTIYQYILNSRYIAEQYTTHDLLYIQVANKICTITHKHTQSTIVHIKSIFEPCV